jgi:hypothetical protein
MEFETTFGKNTREKHYQYGLRLNLPRLWPAWVIKAGILKQLLFG